jgi:glutathione S-transferase
MKPVVLHHCVSARSFRPLWMLEELGLPYELRMLPFPPRALARGFLDVNPTGTVPAFFDGATRMTESVAISHYLAARYSPGVLAVDVAEAEFGPWLNWLHFGEATLTFPQTLVLRYGRFEPMERRQPQIVEDYTKWFLARLRTLQPVLADREFLCAGRFTAADVSVGYALLLADHLGYEPRFEPAVRAYWQRLRERPAFLRSLQAEREAAVAQGVSPVAAPDTPGPE